jgi:hypothetical protein
MLVAVEVAEEVLLSVDIINNGRGGGVCGRSTINNSSSSTKE